MPNDANRALTVTRHQLSDPERSASSGKDGDPETMLTVTHSRVTGELIRWASAEGDLDYEARLIHPEDSAFDGNYLAVYALSDMESAVLVCTALLHEWQDLQ